MSNNQETNVAIYGVGNFGYAILKHLDNKNPGNIKLSAYDYEPEVISSLKNNRHHPFLFKEVKISEEVRFVEKPGQLFDKCDVLVLAVSSNVTREVLQTIKPFLRPGIKIVNTAKALDSQTGKRLSEIFDNELKDVDYSYSLFAGGTIAKDLFAHEPLGADIACTSSETLQELKALFESNNLFIHPTSDLRGVEYASALKNIISVIAGIVKGLGFSYGSETHIISHTADQIGEVCINKLGAKPETFSVGSQCWGNDMWMSCTGPTRNREFGELIGSGLPVDGAIKKMQDQHKTVEAMNTIKVIDEIPGLKDIPVLKLLSELLHKKTVTHEAFKSHLLTSY